MVSFLWRNHAGADVDYQAGAFMTEDGGEEAFRIGPAARELIGVTNPRRLYFDQNLSSLWSVEIDLRHLERFAGLECH